MHWVTVKTAQGDATQPLTHTLMQTDVERATQGYTNLDARRATSDTDMALSLAGRERFGSEGAASRAPSSLHRQRGKFYCDKTVLSE